MDNLKSPAYPELVSTNKPAYGPNFTHNTTGGFTNLELASLMIAQGMLSGPHTFEGDVLEGVSKNAVKIAKAVLEEANK